MEMHGLLSDNITLTNTLSRRQTTFPQYYHRVAPPTGGSSISSCVYCFLTYLAVLVQNQTIWDCLVYARLIVQEALHHGGRGWLDYDRLFQQQAASDPSLHWGSLHPSQMASTVLSQHSGTGSFCGLCKGCDHSPSDCATTFHWYQKHIYSCRHPVCQGPPSRSTQICLSWNDGRCAATPGPCCRLQVCTTCGSPHHRAKKCRDIPTDFRFSNPSKRGRMPLPQTHPLHHVETVCGTPVVLGTIYYLIFFTSFGVLSGYLVIVFVRF